MELFTPGWKSKDIDKAIDAVKRIKKPDKLGTIAVQAALFRVAKTALDQLAAVRDEETIAAVILKEPANEDIAYHAVSLLNDPDLLMKIAQEAKTDGVRLCAVSRLKKQKSNFDLTPYNDLIRKNVEQGYSDAFGYAVSLTSDLTLLKKRYQTEKSLCSKHRFWDKSKKNALENRINELMSQSLTHTENVRTLAEIAANNLYSNKVREKAVQKLTQLKMPAHASQQQIYEAAVNFPLLRKKALTLLTDEELLCRAIRQIAKKGNKKIFCDKGYYTYRPLSTEADRIRDPKLLSDIAADQSLDEQTREAAAKRAGIKNPFGNLTYVCKRCGGAAVFRTEYESIDSWQIEKWVECEGCGLKCGVEELQDYFSVAQAPNVNLRDNVIFRCSRCGKDKQKCLCGSTSTAVPVKYHGL